MSEKDVIDLIENSKDDSLNLSDVEVSGEQVRTNVSIKGLEELKASIERNGLLQPIIVYENTENVGAKYKLIAGQRRFLSMQELASEGRLLNNTIKARILQKKPSIQESWRISLNENKGRKELPSKDELLLFNKAYQRCNESISLTAKLLGVPNSRVTEVIKYEAFPDSVKNDIENGEYDRQVAERAMRAIGSGESGDFEDENKIRTLAREMNNLTREQQKEAEKIAKDDPTATPTQVIEDAKTAKTRTKLQLALDIETNNALAKASKDKEEEPEDVAYNYVEFGLERDGYLET